MNDVIDFLNSKAVKYKKAVGKEIIVNPCPSCGNAKWKCYVNTEKGLFHCKVCDVRGGLFKLKSLYGVVEHVASLSDAEKESKPLDWKLLEREKDALLNSQDALEYLHKRGFTDETINHFNLGYKKSPDGEWVGIPHVRNNELWNIKYRRFAGGEKDFRRIAGQPTIIFNEDNVSDKKDTLYVTESETDCIAAWQMGVENVVSLTGGAKGFKPEWKAFFNKFQKVYLLLDSDQVGQEGARQLADKVGLRKVYNVVLPTKDVNQYMLEKSPQDFKTELSKAERFEIKDVSTLQDVMDKWDDWFKGDDKAIQGLSTGFERLDNITRGFKAGDLIILSGNTGIGKTTFVMNMVNHIIRNGHPVLGFFLEGQIEYMIARMVGAHYNLTYDEIPKDADRYKNIKDETAQLPLHWYSGPQGGLDIAKLKEFIPAVVDLYGIKFLIIDNLQKVVRGADAQYTQRMSDTVSTIKDLLVDMKIPGLLIAHPRKTVEKVITMYDAKSSSTIYQDADQYWILQRIKEERYLTIEKNRMGQDNVNIKLDVDMAKAIFRERPEEAQPADRPSQEVNF